MAVRSKYRAVLLAVGLGLLMGAGVYTVGRLASFPILGRQPQVAPREGPPPLQPSPDRLTFAPDFTHKTFDGRTLRLRALRGKPVVMNFWASWCVPCQREAPNLERAWRAFRDQGVVFLGVNIVDTEEDAREFIRAFKVSYPNVRDPTQHTMTAYKVTAIPTTIFITRDGRIQRRYVGGFLGEKGYQQLVQWTEDLMGLGKGDK